MQFEALLKFTTKLYKNTAREEILRATKKCANSGSYIEKAPVQGYSGFYLGLLEALTLE
jgi:hypothetical protein